MKDERICPSCGKAALPVATRCPRCGIGFDLRFDRPAVNPRPSRNGLMWAGLLALLALIAANGLRQWAGQKEVSIAGMPAPPLPSAVTSTPAVAERDPVAPVATTARTEPAPVPAPARPSLPPPARRAALPAAAQRYASTWINVRSARSSQAPVLRVLQPGESVQVDSLAQGWYQIVTADEVQGYADRRLLSEAAPLNR